MTTEKRFPEIPSCPPFVYLFPSRFPSLDFADFQIRDTHTHTHIHSAFLIKARRFKRDVAGKPEETRLVTMVKRASLILSPLGGGGGKDGERNGCRLNTLRLECENARCVCAREGRKQIIIKGKRILASMLDSRCSGRVAVRAVGRVECETRETRKNGRLFSQLGVKRRGGKAWWFGFRILAARVWKRRGWNIDRIKMLDYDPPPLCSIIISSGLLKRGEASLA